MAEREFYVPIALTNLEAIAAKSACAAVATSGPVAGLLSPDHPLMSAALKIEQAWREARDKADDEYVRTALAAPNEQEGEGNA